MAWRGLAITSAGPSQPTPVFTTLSITNSFNFAPLQKPAKPLLQGTTRIAAGESCSPALRGQAKSKMGRDIEAVDQWPAARRALPQV